MKIQTSKLFWSWLSPLVIPVQLVLNWISILVIAPLHLTLLILNRRYEKKTFGVKPIEEFESGEVIIRNKGVIPNHPNDLRARAKEMWRTQYDAMVHEIEK